MVEARQHCMDAPGAAAARFAPCGRCLTSESSMTRSATSVFALPASAGLLENASRTHSHESSDRLRRSPQWPSGCAALSAARRALKSWRYRFRAPGGDRSIVSPGPSSASVSAAPTLGILRSTRRDDQPRGSRGCFDHHRLKITHLTVTDIDSMSLNACQMWVIRLTGRTPTRRVESC